MLELYHADVDCFLVYSNDFTTVDETNCRLLHDLAKLYKVIIGFGVEKSNLNYILDEVKPFGIGLQGSDEIRPGLKTFDELEEIFEALEE